MSNARINTAIAALILSAPVLGGCAVARATGNAAMMPVKVVYKAGEMTGQAVYYAGMVPVNIADGAMDRTERMLSITADVVDMAGDIVTITKAIPGVELASELATLETQTNVVRAAVDIFRGDTNEVRTYAAAGNRLRNRAASASRSLGSYGSYSSSGGSYRTASTSYGNYNGYRPVATSSYSGGTYTGGAATRTYSSGSTRSYTPSTTTYSSGGATRSYSGSSSYQGGTTTRTYTNTGSTTGSRTYSSGSSGTYRTSGATYSSQPARTTTTTTTQPTYSGSYSTQPSYSANRTVTTTRTASSVSTAPRRYTPQASYNTGR